MSLPLTRRIARAALLTAAGAASVVGAAGSASAAPDLPATPNLGGLAALDGTADGDKDAVETTPTVDQTGESISRKAEADATRSAERALGDHVKVSDGMPAGPKDRKNLLPQGTPLKGTLPLG
ncbi:ATP-binding protein [Streptomyces phyllanthi]|uniref:ATP-binding protein n=1 Tax=Streptomyces phyllanthi TaxID=1803180 RepID=UPI001D14DF6B|nr:ATP-binding protein [Streptomyces phyllanthi]